MSDNCIDPIENIENTDLKAIEEHEKQLKLDRRRQRHEEIMRVEQTEIQQQKEKALKGMKYLLSISETYSNLIKEKLLQNNNIPTKKGPKNKKIKPLVEKNIFKPTAKDIQVTDDVKVENGDNLSLSYFTGGVLLPYQQDGVEWLVSLFINGLNGMLADEMGLGKTIQAIALICHLMKIEVAGPYLIVCPLSTLPNWLSEFERFAPAIPVVKFHGDKHERLNQQKFVQKFYTVGEFKTQPVVITPYSMPLLEFQFLNKLHWQYIIVDEGHRIKDPECNLSRNLRTFKSRNRLLLTGTPLQNNITELWALLNFLVPHIFKDMDTFAALFALDEIKDKKNVLEQEEKNNLVSTIHRVLAPFMLRRLKKEVLENMVPKKEVIIYCPLSKLQRELYQFVLTRDIKKLLGEPDVEENIDLEQPRKKRKCTMLHSGHYKELSDKSYFSEENLEKLTKYDLEYIEKKKEMAQFIVYLTMSNTAMMYKKIVDHPYLVHFPLDLTKPKRALLIDEGLVESSGKLMVLDAMLPKLKQQGHKVLIFSTLVMCLDLIEEFLLMRNYNYRKLDGSHKLSERADNMREFNNDPDILVFLISTRAGGLGLNLVGADTVIFFDRDWNPQVDVQAQDRCHRLGQTKPVMVYSLVTKNTIDEKVITRGHMKRRLEKIVIKDGKFKTLNDGDKNRMHDELLELQTLLNSEPPEHNYIYSELDKLLDRSELYKQMKK